MKLGLKIFSIVILASQVVVAQDYNKALKKELSDVEQMYPAVTKVKSKTVKAAAEPVQIQIYGPQLPVEAQQVQQVQVVAPVAAAPQVQAPAQQANQPIYILQQPTTTIEAAPVKETRTEQLRKQREEIERQNEMKLMERLEDERLNAEKERSEKLLAPAAVATPTPTPTPAVAPVVVVPVEKEVVPAGSVKPEAVAVDKDLTPGQIIAGAAIINKIEENHSNQFVIGASGGATEYPSAGNVSGSFAFGGSAELRFPNRFGIEGGVNYSSFDITNVSTCYYCNGSTLVTTMNQWDVSAGFKYTIFKATISPIVGAMLDYTRRNYTARVTYGYNNPSYTGSNAFSGGFLAGFEVKASDSIIIGGQVQYMMNISYRTDDPLAYGYGGYVYNVGVPIETLNYYFATLNTKFLF